MRYLIAIALSLSVLLGAVGCSSLLYYPTKVPYSNPEKFKHKPDSIFFTSEDGVKLHGWYFRTKQRPAKATFLFFHGNAQNLTSHFYSLYWAVDKGFDVFIFDYRGYGLSEGEPTPEGLVKDGQAALKWIKENKDPQSKLILFGQSLGGAVSLKVACQKRDDFDKIVVDSAFHSYRSIGRKVLTRTWITWPFQWVGWLLLSDSEAPKECIRDISPKPILVVHGTNDPIVEFEFGERVFELAGEPKEFWRIEGGGHTDFLFVGDRENQNRLVEWVMAD